MSEGTYGGSDCILVAVGSAPSSGNVVRWAVRYAEAVHADCVALSVEPEHSIPVRTREVLDANLSLARLLGAKVEIVRSGDIAGTIIAIARDYGARMIVLGRSAAFPAGFRWGFCR